MNKIISAIAPETPGGAEFVRAISSVILSHHPVYSVSHCPLKNLTRHTAGGVIITLDSIIPPIIQEVCDDVRGILRMILDVVPGATIIVYSMSQSKVTVVLKGDKTVRYECNFLPEALSWALKGE